MLASRWVVSILAVGACLLLCGTSAADPSTVRPLPVYGCGQWLSPPAAEVGLFDVYLPSGSFGPSDTLRQAVLRAGGRIVHEFNVSAVRAELRITDIAGPLPNGGYVLNVEGDPSQYSVYLNIGFWTAVTDTDRAFLTSLGATIVDDWGGFIPAVEVIIPDGAIPAVRANPSVKYAEPDWFVCFNAARSTTWGHVKSLYR